MYTVGIRYFVPYHGNVNKKIIFFLAENLLINILNFN